MNTTTDNWRERCSELGLDPYEVKSVSQRFDMYQEYYEENGRNALPLARWYKWYRVEKLSEGHATLQPPAQGCSIDAESSDPSQAPAVVSETEFLELLQAFRSGG